MPRGPLTEETKMKRALEKAAALLGKTVEEVRSSIPENVETEEDRVREAASVIDFFSNYALYSFETCRACGEKFAYRWRFAGVKHCSVMCNNKTLKDMGLSWDPKKSPQERWQQNSPAVVPPQVLQQMRDLYGLLVSQLEETSDEESEESSQGSSVSQI